MTIVDLDVVEEDTFDKGILPNELPKHFPDRGGVRMVR
ncbi:MAG: hypothetical protein BLITH_0312 [Brockia lithotrophica]|uniref:Uncharacterized protein n=1 Tax=Brockia lithotrophica TaxID=933949 RepID=A0A2T5GAM0_9BACL|nr:MAG: hypothetical protein BLITH_0312 [Brockia lithotrophica]